MQRKPGFKWAIINELHTYHESINTHHITTHHITSHHITSHHITSHHITSHHITSHHITSHHITSHHITSHHITSHPITSHHITSHHITSHHIPDDAMYFSIICYFFSLLLQTSQGVPRRPMAPEDAPKLPLRGGGRGVEP